MMSGVKSLTVKKRNVIFLDSLQGMREKSTVYLPDALLLFFPFQGGRLVLHPAAIFMWGNTNIGQRIFDVTV